MRDDIASLNRTVRAYFKKRGRAHLLWRKTRDPYRVLVSEVMLQQTQVARVEVFYKKFLTAFPDARALSRATLPEVLALWQGLGYNRRAKMLRDAARAIEEKYGGKFPRSVEDLDALPGVGPYTARAVAAFAFNKPEVFVETNIRSVFLHHCFSNIVSNKGPSSVRKGRFDRVIDDKEILPLVAEALGRSRMEPRDFYAALMDYGSHLKKSGLRNNDKSKHYVPQSKFKGSRRELRGQILRLLLEKPQTTAGAARRTGRAPEEVREELERLQKEKLIIRAKRIYRISPR